MGTTGITPISSRIERTTAERRATREIAMVYKGDLKVGDTVRASMQLSRVASGPAVLHVAGAQLVAEPPGTDGALLEAGDRFSMDVTLTSAGRLRVGVVLHQEGDRATLMIGDGDGVIYHAAEVDRNTVWVYTVS